MKKLISASLAALMLASSLAGCSSPQTESMTSSEAGIAKYTAYLEEHLDKMPDSLVIASAEDSASYGVDMTEFAVDGFLTRAEDGEVVILGKSDEGLDRAVRDYVKYGNENDYFKTYGEGYRVKKLTIAGNDISEYAVVYDSDDYNGNIALAASELVAYIEKTCGARIASYTDSEYAALADKPARTITLTVDYPALGNEAFRVEVDGSGNLTIYGGRVHGCLYGVYDFLEENVGWRFMDDVLSYRFDNEGKVTIEYLYEAEHVDLTSAINRTEEPLFDSRRIADESEHVRMAAKEKISVKWASGHGLTYVDYTGTSFEGMVNSGVQPCLNDEEILEVIDEYVLNTTRSAIGAGKEIGRDFFGVSLGQLDYATPCDCKECLNVLKEEKSHSGSVIRMANRAAQLLKDNDYGEVHINVLAYTNTDTPPAITVPLDNVRVSFCFYLTKDHITCNAHTIDGKDCDPNSSSSNIYFAEKFEKWVEVCAPGNLDVWYYPFHWYNTTCQAPMMTNLYADIKYLVDYGPGAIIRAVHSDYVSGGQIQALSAYLLNEICWQFPESYEEFDAMIREWFFITYGDAWEPLYEYFSAYEKMGKLNGCYAVFSADTHPKSYVSNEYMAKNFDYFHSLFEEAKSLADTEYQYGLIERYESGMLWLCLGSTYETDYVNGTAEDKAEYTERYTEMHRIFTEYRLPIYAIGNRRSSIYAPDFDVSVSPFDWIG